MLRLDLFLPFFRKRKRDEPTSRPVTGVWAPFLSDPETGRKGLIPQGRLKKIGETWLSSPWRRVVQALFFALFVVLFTWVCWPYGGVNYAQHREAKEKVAAEFFLIIDPLVSLSTALASKSWVWSLISAGIILAVVPGNSSRFLRICLPSGTVIDLFDWAWDGGSAAGNSRTKLAAGGCT